MSDPLIYAPFADFATSYDGPMLPLGTLCAIVTWDTDKVRPTSVLRRGGILVGTSADNKVAHLCFKLEDGYTVEEVDITFVGVDCTTPTTRDAIAEWVEGALYAPDEDYEGHADERAWINAVMGRKWADVEAVTWTQFEHTFYFRDLEERGVTTFVVGVSTIVRHLEEMCAKAKAE